MDIYSGEEEKQEMTPEKNSFSDEQIQKILRLYLRKQLEMKCSEVVYVEGWGWL